MKKVFYATLALALLLSSAMTMSAQTYYILKNKVDITKVLAPSGTTITQNPILNYKDNDVLSSWQTLPFPLSIYGKSVTGYYASDNGYITFDTTQTKSFTNNSDLPLGAKVSPKMAIFAFWYDFDLNLTATDGAGNAVKSQVVNYTYGTSPNRTHVIFWKYLTPTGTTQFVYNYVNFMLAIHENGDIQAAQIGGSLRVTPVVNGTIGIQMDGTDGTSFPSPSAFNTAAYDVYSIIKGTQPDYDLKATALTSEKYYEANKAGKYVYYFQNMGKKDLNSIDINLVAEGNTKSQTVNFTTPLKGSGNSATITAGNLTLTKSKTNQTFQVYVSKPNGFTGTIATPEDDTLKATVYVSGGLPQRKVLVEEFSSATCNPCAAINPAFMAALNNAGNEVAIVRYQGPIPAIGDPMYAYAKTDVDARMTYYGVNSHPNARISGIKYGGHPASILDVNSSGTAFTGKSTFIDQEYSRGAGASMTTTVKNNGGNKFNFSFDITPAINQTADLSTGTTNVTGEYRLFVALVANRMTFTGNPLTTNFNAWNKEDTFNYTFRGFISSNQGDGLGNISEGTKITKSYDYTITDPDNQVGNLRLTAWVQNSRTGEVLNSVMLDNNFSVGIESNTNVQIPVTISPNPTNGISKVQFSLNAVSNINATVVDMTGRAVQNIYSGKGVSGVNTLNLDATQLSKGIYFINLTVNGAVSTQKFIVE